MLLLPWKNVVVPGGEDKIEGVEEVVGDIGSVDNMEVPGGEDVSVGVEEVVGERPKESVDQGGVLSGGDASTIGGVYGMEEMEGGVDVGGAEGGAGSGDNGGGSGVEPIHHIPRWRLREILAHAEGECILLV